jgi:cyclic-di-AMP phosphodiesterase PgpH
MVFKKKKKSLADYFALGRSIRWVLLVAVTLTFVLILHPGLFATKRNYRAGDVVERDIKAPRNFFIENKAATETLRKRTVGKVLTVYDHDVTLLPKLITRVEEAFKKVRIVIKAEQKRYYNDLAAESREAMADLDLETPTVHDLVWKMKPEFEEALAIPVSSGAYHILQNEEFSQETSNFIIRILNEILTNGVVANKELLLREEKKGIALRDVATQSEIVVKKLRKLYGLDQSKTMVRIIGDPLLEGKDYTLRNLVVDFVQALIQPNITLNRNETESRKQAAVADVNPVRTTVVAGEMILREGERVTENQLRKLNALQSVTNRKKFIASGAGAGLMMMCMLVVLYVLITTRRGYHEHMNNRNMLFLSSVFIIFILLTRVWSTVAGTLPDLSTSSVSSHGVALAMPLAAGAMTVCLFLGLRTAVSVGMVLAVTAAILFGNRLDLLVYFLISGTMGAFWIQHCRERMVFIKAGLRIGLLNILLATAIHAYGGELIGMELVWSWVFALLGGVVAGIAAAGFAPMFEILFNYTTDIKLLELANLDRPILRRLMIEAPGTYHHSVIVGSLVEAAAAEINANPLLAKVCGYYHDIGKLKMPLYFIENQAHGVNKHDKLNPSMSKRILIAHIKDGVEFAKQNRLGQNIIDTVIQHHGTSVIRYFYDKAQKIGGENEVDIDDYRYPGPRPQTREAGLVMLADVVEAASRTLANPTPSRIQGLVQNLINKIFSDGQLDNCELTLKDLHNIARSFNQILNGIHHHRIEYPESATAGNGKGKNGGTDRQQTKQIQNIPSSDKTNGEGRLRRLGLH